MYCNQCEQTSGNACTVHGVCGKTDNIAQLQDLLIYALRLLSNTLLKAEKKNYEDSEGINKFIAHALFMTLTNVNFSELSLNQALTQAILHRKKLAEFLGCKPDYSEEGILKSLQTIKEECKSNNELVEDIDINSTLEILLYGVKGVAAYVDHAEVFGKSDPAVYDFIKKALIYAVIVDENSEPITLERSLELVLECGKANVRAMELLEQGNTEAFGHPIPTTVNLGHKEGKAILITGHDLNDLYHLLKQTEGTGINVYTHGEMLPAHGYPKLKEFSHFVGHYGTAWQNQKVELQAFPGAVLFTTNCIQNPAGYNDKIFTTGAVAWEGTTHCEEKDFSKVIAKALELEGFNENFEGKNITVGFGRKTLLEAAPAVLEAVKGGAIKHIFLVGGCDGAKSGRNYYTEFVEKTPKDTLILTLACGKFRFFDKDLGMIGDFPRLLDLGQCNDAYAAVQVALALAEALNCSVNDLPLSLVLSWYEQKAVSILLSLLALGVKNVRLGPSLPKFVSPNVLQVLIDNWNLTPITNAEEDIANLMKS